MRRRRAARRATARTIASYAARPASADSTPGANVASGRTRRTQPARTRRGRERSAAARRAISGPMPAGSPSVIAMRRFQPYDQLRSCRSRIRLPQPPVPHPRRVVAAAFAAAAAVLHAFGVGQLVAQAALQPAAQARQLRRVEAQLLLLRHLDRHRLERRQKRRAAERTAARAVAADHLRFVAHADLPHLDARAELRRELAHELAEIDAAFGREIEDQPRTVERLLDARELHAEAALADLQRRDPVRVTLALLVLQPHDDVVVRGEADHARRRFAGRAAAARRSAARRGRRCRRRGRRRSARRPARRDAGAASARAARKETCAARPTGVSLTETSRGFVGRAHTMLLTVEHQPVRDDLDAGIRGRAPSTP